MTEMLNRTMADVFDRDYGDSQPVAVIAAACRFPRSATVESFWRNIADGVDFSTELDREALVRAGVPSDYLGRPDFVARASIVEEAENFDAAFFGYSPQEAESIDPQQRIFLTIAWEALDSAGYAERISGRSVGVFGACRMSTYQMPERDNLVDVGAPRVFQRLIGNDKDYLATRVSYKLGLTGPALTVQTACSSSLVAVHTACEQIRNGECEMALAGGVGISFPQETGYRHYDGMVFSPDGLCRPYDAQGQGTTVGNGAGIVLLKSLDEAIADGDPILAVIRGSAVNNDGTSKVGFTAPSVDGQTAAIREALGMAEIDPATIGLVEGHGTATPLGDPIEVAALTSAYREHTDERGYCALGSVKSNLGHTDTAAGIASLLKAVMAVRHGLIPPSLHFDEPNPELELENSPFYVPSLLTPWLKEAGLPRRAAVSSFGVGGTNCHLVLEEAPLFEEPQARDQAAYSVAISAHTEEALRSTALRYATELPEVQEWDLAEWSEELASRLMGEWRLAVAGSTVFDLADNLQAFAEGRDKEFPSFLQKPPASEHKLAFLFTGQGSQQAGMGYAYHRDCPVFRKSYDRCAAEVWKLLDVNLVDVVDSGNEQIFDPVLCQPALVAFEYAMAKSWQGRGLKPEAVMGHSLGEMAAAAFVGLISPEDAVRLAIRRAQLVAELPDKGSMAVLHAARHQIEELLKAADDDRLAIAAENGLDNVAIAGPTNALKRVMGLAEREGIGGQLLATSHAFHSPMLEPVLEQYRMEAKSVVYEDAECTFFSTVTGRVEKRLSPDHWRDHLRQEVKFASTIMSMADAGFSAFLEVGPAATLTAMGPRCVAGMDGVWIPSRRHNEDEAVTRELAFSALRQAGLIESVEPVRRRVHLPPRALDERKYWNPIPAIGADDRKAVMETPKDDDNALRKPWDAAVEAGMTAASSGIADLDLGKVAHEEAGVTTLHAAYTGEALRKLGCFESPEDRWTLGELLRASPIKPKFRQLLGRMMRDLVSAGVLRKEERHFTGFKPIDPSAVAPLLEELRQRGDVRLAGLIERGGGALADMLAGRVDPVSVIFPQGSSDDVEDMYQNGEYSRYFNKIAADCISAYACGHDAAIRVLEVGGGTGGTTWDVVQGLRDCSLAEYMFTDIGPVFLKRAREKFARFPFMEYGIFDMERDAEEQGFLPGRYDVILAANVLHNARDLRAMLDRLSRLLRPGGILVMREITAHKKLFDFVFGPLVPPLEDIEERGGNLFADRATWQAVAESSGFESFAGIPGDKFESSVLGEDILLCHKPGQVPAEAAQTQSSQDHVVNEPVRQVGSYADLLDALFAAAEAYDLSTRQLADLHLIKPAGNVAVRLTCNGDRLFVQAVTDQIVLASARVVAEPFPSLEEETILEEGVDGNGVECLLEQVTDGATALSIASVHRRSGCAAKMMRTGEEVYLADANGRPVFVLSRPVPARMLAETEKQRNATGDCLYRTIWDVEDTDSGGGLYKLVLIDGGDGLAASITNAGTTVLSYAAKPDEVDRAVSAVLQLGSPILLDCRGHDNSCPDPVARPMEVIQSFVAVVDQFRQQNKGRPMHLALLTQGIVSVSTMDEVADPIMSGLLGLIRVASNEFPELCLQLIDIDDARTMKPVMDRIADRRTGCHVLRMGQWHVERLVRHAPDLPSLRLDRDGSVLIVGGLSEMGVTLSHWLVDLGILDLVLLGHSGMSEDRKNRVEELRQRGANVRVATVDAGDPESLEEVLKTLLPTGRRLTAIFHLAGVVEDTLLSQFDEEAFERVLRPKWNCAVVLDRMEDKLKPDLTVYFSSATTVFGPAGQAAHATANAMLEGLARQRSQIGRPTRAIAWGFWSDIRRQEREEMARKLAEGGMQGLETSLGLALLQQVIGRSEPVLAAMKVDWPKIGSLVSSGHLPGHLEELASAEASEVLPAEDLPAQAATEDPLDQVLSAGGVQRRAALLVYLKDRVATLLQRPAVEVDENANLIQLGLDSLMFLDFSHRLSSELGVSVSADTAFAADTLVKLATHLEGQLPDGAVSDCAPEAILAAPAQARADMIRCYLQERIATLVQLPVSELPTDQNLIQIGLDSLMFLDLSHTISSELDVSVTAEAAFELSSISDLAAHIERLMAEKGPNSQDHSQSKGSVVKTALPAEMRDAQGDLRPRGLMREEEVALPDGAAVIRARRLDGQPFAEVQSKLYAEWDKDAFNLDRFQSVWNRLVQRHPMLRSTETEAGLLSFAETSSPYQIAIVDHRDRGDAEVERALFAIRDEMQQGALVAGEFPRFDIRASVITDDRIRLHMALDARIADTESFQVILREMDVLMQDPQAKLPALDLTVADYKEALNLARNSEMFEAIKKEWLDRLHRRSPYPLLPLSGAGEDEKTTDPNHEIRILPYENWMAVREKLHARGLTSTALISAVFANALARQCGKEAFSLDLRYFNRLPLHAQTMNLVGDFTAMMPVNWSPDRMRVSMQEQAGAIQVQIAEGRAVGDFSALSVMRDGACIPDRPAIAFTTLLGIDADYPLTETEDPVLGLPQFEQVTECGYALNLQALEHERGLILTLDHFDGYYEGGLVAALVDDLLAVLDSLRHDDAWHLPADDLQRLKKGHAA